MIPATGASAVLDDPAFQGELQQAAQASGKTLEQAQTYARKCLHEIEATPRESWLNPAAKLARFVYTRSYERELDINLQALDELRELSKDHLLLFCGHTSPTWTVSCSCCPCTKTTSNRCH